MASEFAMCIGIDMKKEIFIADLHIHSRYSRATSKDCSPEFLDLWARRKGIDLIGTGDFTHPAWREELKEKLIAAEQGFYVLKEKFRIRDGITDDSRIPKFVVSGEISSIYKKKDKVRKIHNLILLPSLEAADRLACKLETIGNIHSDGRPILGLDSRDLLEITMEICSNAIFIPAHIWTPHFSLFGAFSGFDRIEDCFEDLTPYIHALETGLSSDPAMNWRLSALDSYQLISNSDAHSPSKLGREASMFQTEMSYEGLERAIQTGEGLYGTIEFFPEEGKYFFDGHRKCGLSLTPKETKEYNGICPICGKKITVGVLHRVEELADRQEGFLMANPKKFESLVPLPEVIASAMGCTLASKKVNIQYEKMLRGLGAEFSILREVPLEDIRYCAGNFIEEGIRRLRTGKVERIAGFDGEYGIIQVLKKEEVHNLFGQVSLFDSLLSLQQKEKIKDTEEKNISSVKKDTLITEKKKSKTRKQELNQEQLEAIKAQDEIISVIAGPGTGKTKTLIERIAYLISQYEVSPEQIMAVTFTNKAAGEMRERLQKQLNMKKALERMHIGTFHSICYEKLSSKKGEFAVALEYEQNQIAKEIISIKNLNVSSKKLLQEISRYKNRILLEKDWEKDTWEEIIRDYENRLEALGMLDFDDLLEKTLKHCKGEENNPKYLLVDEMQDLNELQYELIKQWHKGGTSLFVIGDPDQAIYGFRGSSSKYFEQLKKDYKEVKEVRLVQNYRSTKEIINCAALALKKQKNRLKPQLDNGEKVSLISTKSNFEEAVYIAKEINRMTGGMDMLDVQNNDTERKKIRSFDEIAILYRTHQQAKVLETCLRKESIPYKIIGREDLLKEEIVQAAISFFKILYKPQDILSFSMYFREIQGYSEKEIQIATELLQLLKITKWTTKALNILETALEKKGIKETWIEEIRYFYPKLKKEKPEKILDQWTERNHLEENESLYKLSCMSIFHKNMNTFLQNLQLGQEADLERNAEKKYNSGVVSLMTLHASKGLEYPVVFLCGIKKGILPLELRKEIDIEEERRLFYVGITRAKEELLLLTSQEPSIFLKDLNKNQLNIEKEPQKNQKQKIQEKQMTLFD